MRKVPLKARVAEELRKLGHEVTDLGTNATESVDYPDYAKAVAEAVLKGDAERWIPVLPHKAKAGQTLALLRRPIPSPILRAAR